MRALTLTAILASVSLVAVGQPPQQQDKPEQDKQEQKKAGQQTPPAPVSLSPMIPVGTPDGTVPPKDAAGTPGTPMAGGAGAKPAIPQASAPVDNRTFIIGALDVIAVSVFE